MNLSELEIRIISLLIHSYLIYLVKLTLVKLEFFVQI